MRLRFTTIVLGAIFTAIAAGNNANTSTSESIAISRTADSIEITVPVSNLVLKCPKGSFVVDDSHRGGAAFMYRNQRPVPYTAYYRWSGTGVETPSADGVFAGTAPLHHSEGLFERTR
jgi:hypothetical protein